MSENIRKPICPVFIPCGDSIEKIEEIDESVIEQITENNKPEVSD